MKQLILLFLLTSFSVNLKAQLDNNLINKLSEMVKTDQEWRGLVRQIHNGKIDSISLEDASKQMQQTDSLNNGKLKQIFQQHGFVGYNVAGKKGSHNFWLLVQHQDKDIDFQLAVLEKMKVAAETKNASYQDYAYLIDRVKVNTGEPQIYGTQMTINADSTSYVPKLVLEPNQLDARRKEAGLPPMDFYINAMNKRFLGTLKKK